MAQINEANHLVIYGRVKIEQLSKAMKLHEYPRDPLPNVGVGEKVAVVLSKERKANDPQGCHRLLQDVQTRVTKAGVGEKTIVNVAKRMATNLLNNLDHHAGTPYASALDKPLRGVPAFVIAAGASLDVNAHLLKECSKHGVIVGMNTSAKAIRAAGAPIDMLVTIESQDVSATMKAALDGKPYPVLALDATSHPSSYDIPADNRMIFVNNDPAFFGPLRALGGDPLPFGGSVATTCVSLCRYFGADLIVLIGQDLAWATPRGVETGNPAHPYSYLDNRCYANNTLKGGLRCNVIDGDLYYYGHPAYEGRNLSYLKQPAWGGRGDCYTTYDLLTFVDWFTKAATAKSAFTQGIINCTEGGIRIPGIPDVPLDKVLRDNMWHSKIHGHRPHIIEQLKAAKAPTQQDVDRYRAGLIADVGATLAAAVKYDKDGGVLNYLAWQMAKEKVPVIDAFMAADCQAARSDHDMPMHEKFDAVLQSCIKCCGEVETVLGGK